MRRKNLSLGLRLCVGVALVCAGLPFGAGCTMPHAPGSVRAAYEWQTLAGLPGGLGNVDGAGVQARFCQPSGVVVDAAGAIYVADYYNYAIRRVEPDGRVTTFAGAVGEPGEADGIGGAARFDRPSGIASDGAGNLYVADSGNHTVRRIASDGAVTTLAGRAGEPGASEGVGREARFRSPSGVAVDRAGYVYVADCGNHTIRKISPAGGVTTLAGRLEMKNGSAVGGYADGRGTAARFRGPRGVAVDGAGAVFVADTENGVIRKIAADGTVRTLAGLAGCAGYVDGTNAAARFNGPQGLAVDAAGTVYVADAGNAAIRAVSAAGRVTTVTNGAALFGAPRGVGVDGKRGLWVVDSDRQTLSRVSLRGSTEIVAGSCSRHGALDGVAGMARFNRPSGLVCDGSGRLSVCDNFNHALRAVGPDGRVSTLAGRLGITGATDGAATNATFSWPAGLARDAEGNRFVADAGNHVIRKVASDGTVSTVAGWVGCSGYEDGRGTKARFASPVGVAVGGDGSLYVADRGNHVVRRVLPDGEVTTLAGLAGRPGRADGAGPNGRFNGPSGVAVDALGNVYVADTGNHTLRLIVPGGEVTTLAGCAGVRGSADGKGSLARFNGPSELALDARGGLFVVDRDNHMIRMVSPEGDVTTVGGAPNAMSCSDGIGEAARFAQPSGIAVGADGRLYVGDACNNRIAVGLPLTEWRRFVRKGRTGNANRPTVEEPPASLPYDWDVYVGCPGRPGCADGVGGAARLMGPQALALDDGGVLYAADGGADALCRVRLDGRLETVALRRDALRAPVALAVDHEGSCVVSSGLHALAVVASDGSIRALAGSAGRKGCADGMGEAARFDYIASVACDAQGNAVVADCNNHTLRLVRRDGTVTTLAGLAGEEGCVDGVGDAARLSRPAAVVRAPSGDFYVACGDRIRRVTAAGKVTTLEGCAVLGKVDGLAVDRGGMLYAADRGNHAIWRWSPGRTGRPVRLSGSEQAMAGSGWLVTGLAVDGAGNVYVADSSRACIMRGKPQR